MDYEAFVVAMERERTWDVRESDARGKELDTPANFADHKRGGPRPQEA